MGLISRVSSRTYRQTMEIQSERGLDESFQNVSLSADKEHLDEFEQLTCPASDSGDSDEIFEVEKILDHRTKKAEFDEAVGRMVRPKEYFVKWKGYGEDYNSWEPLVNLQESCFEIIKDYEKNLANQSHLQEL